MAVLNRDDPRSRCIVGPNRVFYDSADGEEYKIFVPVDYLRNNTHPILNYPQPIIELYGTKIGNRELKLGNQMTPFEQQNDIN